MVWCTCETRCNNDHEKTSNYVGQRLVIHNQIVIFRDTVKDFTFLHNCDVDTVQNDLKTMKEMRKQV